MKQLPGNITNSKLGIHLMRSFVQASKKISLWIWKLHLQFVKPSCLDNMSSKEEASISKDILAYVFWWDEPMDSKFQLFKFICFHLTTVLCAIGVVINVLAVFALLNKRSFKFNLMFRHLFVLLNLSNMWVATLRSSQHLQWCAGHSDSVHVNPTPHIFVISQPKWLKFGLQAHTQL